VFYCKHDTGHTNTVCVVKCSFLILVTVGGACGYHFTGNLATKTVQHGLNTSIYSDNGGYYYYCCYYCYYYANSHSNPC
jgi:hypothetical protein